MTLVDRVRLSRYVLAADLALATLEAIAEEAGNENVPRTRIEQRATSALNEILDHVLAVEDPCE